MKNLLIEPHYLGSVAYYSRLLKADTISFEVCESFPKQTYRNRCYFLLSNKVQPLILPVSYRNGDPTKDVTIDHSQRWKKDHWGAFYSAYGKAPFYDYFSEEFQAVWDKQHHFLVDLLMDFFALTVRLLQVNPVYTLTDRFEETSEHDARNTIHPKDKKQRNSEQKAYSQLFGEAFTPDLSIVDLLMNQGPASLQFIS